MCECPRKTIVACLFVIVLPLLSACTTKSARRESGWWLAGAGIVVSSAGFLGVTPHCSPDHDFCREIVPGGQAAFWVVLGVGVVTSIIGLAMANAN